MLSKCKGFLFLARELINKEKKINYYETLKYNSTNNFY